jgi:ABC-type uncharacterized transport system substrate-binding protein
VPTLAAKAATATIPIVFSVGEDPVKLGLVASLARPGGNVTGINIQNSAVVAKRLLLLHDVLPKAVRIAALVNPGNASVTESTTRELEKAAPTMGLQVQILPATTIGEIDAAFATFAGERPDALFISRRAQLVTLAARDRIPAIYPARDIVQAGGLMSYGVNLAEMLRLVGVYSGSILQGRQARRPACAGIDQI